MIPLRAKRAKIFSEFTPEEQSEYFGLKDKCVRTHIDTLYYFVRIRGDTKESDLPGMEELLTVLANLKDEKRSSYSVDVDFHGLNVETSGFSIYEYRLSLSEMFDIFVTKYLPNDNTPRIVVQLRTRALILHGPYEAVRESMEYVKTILASFHLSPDIADVNRVDYAYHTNIIQNPMQYFNDDRLRQNLRSTLTKYNKYGSIRNEVTLETLSLGNRKSNNIYYRSYDKTREVIEKAYKSFFIDKWLADGLISKYDHYVLMYAYNIGSYVAGFHLGRMYWYIEHGHNEATKAFFKDLIKKYRQRSDNNKALKKQLDEYIEKDEEGRMIIDSLLPPVTITLSGDNVLLSAVEGATHYKLFYSLNGVTWDFVHTILPTSGNTTINLRSSLSAVIEKNVSYKVSILACDDTGSYVEGERSATLTWTPTIYSVSTNLTGGILLGVPDTLVYSGAAWNTTISPGSSNELPDTIEVTMGGTVQTAGAGYTYDSTTGAVNIPSVTGDVKITIVCPWISYDAPANLAINGKTVTWDAVPDAKEYTVRVYGDAMSNPSDYNEYFEVTTNSFDLSQCDIRLSGDYFVAVWVPVGDGAGSNASSIKVSYHNAAVTISGGSWSGNEAVLNGTNGSWKFNPFSGNTLPISVTVKMNGTVLQGTSAYTYDSGTGDLTVYNVTGDLEITVTCPDEDDVLAAPRISNITTDNVLVWNKVEGATQYHVYVNGTLYATCIETSLSLDDLGAGTYTLAVKAKNDLSISELSTTETITYRSVTKSISYGSCSGTKLAANGYSYSCTLTPNSGRTLPTSITVKMGGTTLSSGYTYSSSTGAITITNVTGDIQITATCPTATVTPTTYSVSVSITNGSSSAPSSVTAGSSISFYISPNTAYDHPTSITVKVSGSTISSSKYTYYGSSGYVNIPSSVITGNVTITASCEYVGDDSDGGSGGGGGSGTTLQTININGDGTQFYWAGIYEVITYELVAEDANGNTSSYMTSSTIADDYNFTGLTGPIVSLDIDGLGEDGDVVARGSWSAN